MRTLPSRLLIPSILLCTLPIEQAQADWITPYTAGSVPDNILRYNTLPAGTVTAPNAPSTLVGITYNNTPVSGSGGGATITTQGATAISALGAVVARTNSQTVANSSGLSFNTVTSGPVGDLVNVSPTMIWSGTSSVTTSNTWDSFGSTSYRYVFDLSLNSSLLSGGVSLFNGVSLTITAGANTLYTASGLTNILGLPSITGSTYNDAVVNFTYNQADGPIVIRWQASSALTGAILSGLGGGMQNVFRFSDGRVQLDVIPEPSTYALLLTAGVAFAGQCYRLRRLRAKG